MISSKVLTSAHNKWFNKKKKNPWDRGVAGRRNKT